MFVTPSVFGQFWILNILFFYINNVIVLLPKKHQIDGYVEKILILLSGGVFFFLNVLFLFLNGV